MPYLNYRLKLQNLLNRLWLVWQDSAKSSHNMDKCSGPYSQILTKGIFFFFL